MTRRSWQSSTRRQRLPRDWPRIRARILTRDRGICHACGQPGATEVDHLVAGDDHQDANLAAIHTACHRSKSSAEGHAARGQGPTRRRPPEQHPGRADPA